MIMLNSTVKFNTSKDQLSQTNHFRIVKYFQAIPIMVCFAGHRFLCNYL